MGSLPACRRAELWQSLPEEALLLLLPLLPQLLVSTAGELLVQGSSVFPC